MRQCEAGWAGRGGSGGEAGGIEAVVVLILLLLLLLLLFEMHDILLKWPEVLDPLNMNMLPKFLHKTGQFLFQLYSQTSICVNKLELVGSLGQFQCPLPKRLHLSIVLPK